MAGIDQPKYPQARAAAPEEASSGHARNISASDLVASLFGQGQSTAPPVRPAGSHPGQLGAAAASPGVAESSSSAAPTAENTQEMLLRLLNRPKPAQDVSEGPVRPVSQSPSTVSPIKSPVPEAELRNILQPSGPVVGESTARPEEPLSGKLDRPSGKESMFTYVNPFEQLAAASPRVKSPQPKSRSESPAVEIMKNKKVSIVAKAENVPAPNPVESTEDKRAASPVLAEEQKEAVTQVVDKLVEEISREVDTAASKSAEQKVSQIASAQEESTQAVISSVASHLRETAAEAKEDTEAVNNKTEKEETEAAAPAAAAKETSQSGSGDALADSWESAEDSAEKEEERVVSVHNFPLKPFISIIVKAHTGKLATLRDDGIMDIARLKKDFDQLDRSLTSATSDYIVYALAKNGGMRIIRQDDGSDKQVFRSARDRVFNVAVCTSQAVTGRSTEEQALLGIGVSGAVYWALISRADKDLFELDALESESLIFPPFPASDENTSGGQLKTRAKRSSRHPGFFAIGRGKNIYVVSPQAAMNPSYGVAGPQRVVNTEKFFKERALKISTGKAGKDFMFSDDDTVIASLDKTGRLRFWDIREAISNPAFFTAGPSPAEVRVPLNTFVTGSPTEKSWPTSVLFIDKLRPYVKSMALRYVLVGLKQNHTLQLWDIGLGKAVQELKFPHENESDAICSVAYHPASGIIVVGHPTRNSIYFVHLSAPRYNLQAMSQASFIKRSGEKDSSLPKPESTACMSGIREISFASKGQLRSLDLLPVTKSAGDESGLFELYVMHSRGVTCLNIKKEDLGWTSDNKIIRPINALEEGLIDIAELQTFPTYVADEPSVNGDSAPTPTKPAVKEIAKKIPELNTEAAAAPAAAGPSTLRTQSPTKLGKEPATALESVTGDFVASVQTPVSGEQFNGDAQKASLAPTSVSTSAPPAPSGSGLVAVDSAVALNKHLEALQSAVSSEFSKSLGREVEGLYQRFDEERRSWDAASAAKQDQVLRLVSSTLSDNVEKNLARIVSSNIQTEVVPALSDLTTATVGKQLNTVIAQQIGGVVPRELRQALPEAVNRAVQHPDLMRVLSDAVGQKLAIQVENEVSKAVHNTVAPAIRNVAAQSAEKVASSMEKQMQAQARQYELQRQNDAAKIDQLTSLVRELSETVSSMATAQAQLQGEVLRLNSALASPVTQPEQQIELEEIAELIHAGRYEEGSVKWLQSSQQADLFDNLFVRLNPSYLTSLSPIVGLSVGVAVTSSLQTNIMPRLTWLEVVLQTVNPMDPDIRELVPRIMDILSQRLEALYMSVAETSPHDPIIRKIAPLSRRARLLRG
ncbi:Glycosyl hydrolase 3 N terminal domain family protein [Aspergillus niger]|uniref:Glycosyl hydrolase 3 N terminal domain family protein n=1 Tax=Aspergillus niger TaxID=5061 RepID=A0A505I9C1_ASPNG|nr:Glycosyl hydrolase 3 N terminal domain family protein [Aspergillus niger]